MAIEVLMPKLGLTMTEGTIEEWKVSEGGAVKKGDVLYTVATDKLTNDVEAEEDGVLLKILVPAGETAECKAVVAYLGASGETAPGGASAPQPALQAPAPVSAPAAPISAPAAPVSAPASAPAAGGRVHASPYARKTARELGVELSDLSGTGPSGRIVWRDVSEAASHRAAPAAPAQSEAAAGLYVTADVAALTAGLASLNGALTLAGFAEKAAARLNGSVVLRAFDGVEGVLPCLRSGETAALGFGAPEGGRLRLNLVYAPAALSDDAAADFLRGMKALLENPLSLLA